MLFTKTHEWFEVSKNAAKIGITDYAQSALGDIVFLDLPEIGAQFSAGDVMAVVESVKTVSDVYAPFDGKVVAVNETLDGAPESVNSDPYGAWLVELEFDGNFGGFMDEASYAKFAAEAH